MDYIDRRATIASKSPAFERLGASEGSGIFKFESLYYLAICLGNGKAPSVEKAREVAKKLAAIDVPCWSEKARKLEAELAQNVGSPEIKERR